MRLNLIGGASGICHFLAISGLALAWGGVGRWHLSCGPRGAGTVLSPLLQVPGPRVPRRRRRREGGQGQARRGDLNLINEATPLRVCFNHQDTLQQVDRMFTVNLHMSSERAVSLRTVRAGGRAGAASLGPGRPSVPLVSGGSGQTRPDGGHCGLDPSSWEFPGLPTKIRAPGGSLRKTAALCSEAGSGRWPLGPRGQHRPRCSSASSPLALGSQLLRLQRPQIPQATQLPKDYTSQNALVHPQSLSLGIPSTDRGQPVPLGMKALGGVRPLPPGRGPEPRLASSRP